MKYKRVMISETERNIHNLKVNNKITHKPIRETLREIESKYLCPDIISRESNTSIDNANNILRYMVKLKIVREAKLFILPCGNIKIFNNTIKVPKVVTCGCGSSISSINNDVIIYEKI